MSETWSAHPSNELRMMQVPDADVGHWLTGTPPLEAKNYVLLRLVWIRLRKDHHPWQLNIQQPSLEVVLEAYRYCLSSPCLFAIVPACPPERSNTLAFSLCMPDLFGVAWTYDARSGRTEGVCWADDWITEAMQAVMSDQNGWAQHPLFLALAASILLCLATCWTVIWIARSGVLPRRRTERSIMDSSTPLLGLLKATMRHCLRG